MRIHAVILAGGRGERFWPLSRTGRPKQFLPLLGGKSLLRQTADRLAGWIPEERWWTVGGSALMPEIRRQLPEIAVDRCIEEPVARNTAAAIGAVACAIHASDPRAVLLVLPSDHWIPDPALFREDVERIAAIAEGGGLHLIGIPITRPDTGYGYIAIGEAIDPGGALHRVSQFREKPGREQAIDYASRPEMLWNSGIFIWKASEILDALRAHVPAMEDLLSALDRAIASDPGRAGAAWKASLDSFFRSAPPESIDNAVLEKHADTFAGRARFRWSDLGTWASWGERQPSDAAGNRGQGKLLASDAQGCVYYAEDGLLALLGVRDLIVVRLGDVTLVCAKDQAQEVKRLVQEAVKDEDLGNYF